MSRTNKIIAAVLAVAAIAVAFEAGALFGARAAPGMSVVKQAWNLIRANYVEKDKIDAAALAHGAVKGMVDALNDPYMAFFEASAYELSMRNLEGTLEGIGAYVWDKDGQVTVIATIAGSPAEKAGIRAGDVIVAVNGKATDGQSLIDVVLGIQGPKGTAVSLSIRHVGEEKPIDLTIVRAEIDVPSVTSEVKGDIEIIKINQFGEHTARELDAVIKAIPASVKGLVLDLRGNPGGLLATVADVAGGFLKGDDVLVQVVNNEGGRTTTRISTGRETTNLPLVVLVDEFSASGSEVLTGALQDYGRAVAAGTTTYGKGSVNTLQQLSDGSGIYITIARWLTPKGRAIEGKGLTPDFALTPEQDWVQWAIDYLHARRAPGA